MKIYLRHLIMSNLTTGLRLWLRVGCLLTKLQRTSISNVSFMKVPTEFSKGAGACFNPDPGLTFQCSCPADSKKEKLQSSSTALFLPRGKLHLQK